jgi:hypothetical protein
MSVPTPTIDQLSAVEWTRDPERSFANAWLRLCDGSGEEATQ